MELEIHTIQLDQAVSTKSHFLHLWTIKTFIILINKKIEIINLIKSIIK
jgi:hypothetical protein